MDSLHHLAFYKTRVRGYFRICADYVDPTIPLAPWSEASLNLSPSHAQPSASSPERSEPEEAPVRRRILAALS